ncbi:MAG: peptidoglycan DD-metalloendopeptidase family protein [Actinomycetaceae bacterium]|nr:peptidoglycan DD-metalloendopeptidase family protein [Actinomycetaceae bacterium]
MRMVRRVIALVVAVGVSVGTLGVGASVADKRDDEVARRDEAATKRQQLEAQLSGIDKELADVYLRLDDVRQEIPGARSDLEEAQSKYASAQREHELVTARLAVAEKDLENIKEQVQVADTESQKVSVAISGLARDVYRSGDASSPLLIAMTSQSTADITQRAATAQTMARTQSRAMETARTSLAIEKNRSARQTAVTERITRLKARAAASEAAALEWKQTASEKLTRLQNLEATETERAQAVEAIRGQAQTQMAEWTQVYDSARAEIARIDEENRRKQIQYQQSVSAPSGGSSGGSVSSVNNGKMFGYPLPSYYPVTSGFGYRYHPVLGARILHAGTDLGAPCGTPVLATANGVVTSANYHYSAGNYVSINYGLIGGTSYQARFLHLSAFNTYVGQSVSRGQVIGYVGTTGRSTGCHLHYEMHVNGQAVNALPYL